MYKIENDQLSITINPKGAELSSIYDKQDQMEYMWNGNPDFWGKKSPVLFPIVGTLKNNVFFFKGNTYEMSRHGFARDKNFEVTEQTQSTIMFTLLNNAETLKVFPFEFDFSILYTLENKCLSVAYIVNNLGNEKMYFSVGGHPAFKLPISNKLNYEDYYLQFNKVENAGRWPISEDGLIEIASEPLLISTDQLPLKKEMFYKDAIVLKHLASNEVQLKSFKDSHGFNLKFQGFPFLGIWAAKDADFLCIEPWCGIADSVSASQQIEEKEGIENLDAGEKFERTWSITIF
ncbi:MAG: aldose 1-epimerase family protein [Ferruginibacter sp.]